jgi:DDE superfamily endonuclease
MTEIVALLQTIAPLLEKTTLRQLSQVVFGMMVASGRITMLGLSRWTEKGGSYRTIQRLYHTILPWKAIQWLFFRKMFLQATDEYLIAGDEVVVSKAGKETYGLDRFFSGLRQQVIPGLSFFAFSLVNVREEQSYPLQIDQIVKCAAEKAQRKSKAEAKQAQKTAEKRQPGRPKGSKNKAKGEVVLNAELLRVQASLRSLLATVGTALILRYVALDGHFGNYPSAYMVRQENLHLISKLRHDAGLYLAFSGAHPGPGPKPKYGAKIDIHQLDPKYLQETTVKEQIRTEIYQGQFYNKEFAFPLNVVIILKTNLVTHAQAHAILFSTDLEQAYEQILHFYSLRFQIEFHFRDAKQYWGLEDFMNVKETAVTNAANLAFFLVNVSQALLQPFRQNQPDYSILDLKSHFRGCRYASETIKMLPQKPDAILLAHIFEQIARLGAIHPLSHPSPAP